MREKPGIVHLVSSFHQGGSERQALQLVRQLRRTGRYDVHLACLLREGALLPLAQEVFSTIDEYRLTSFYNATAVTQLIRFSRWLRRRGIKVVQTHDFYSNVFGIATAALARVPVRIAARRETGGIRTRRQKSVEQWAYSLAHVVVANAEAVRDQLIAEGVPAGKVVTIYNGLEIERLRRALNLPRAELLAKLNFPVQGSRYVTIVANMRYAVKDHQTFLRCAQLVHGAFPDAVFVLAGEGEMERSLRELAAELGLERRAVFTGRCELVPELLAVSDVCVLSSRAEGFPNAVLEYMAAGRPVVATDVGGVREAITNGENGYIVRVGDVQQMATKVIALLADPQLGRSMGATGRTVAEERFSTDVQLARTEALYNRLLAKA